MSQNSKKAVKTVSFVMLITLAGKLLGLYRDRLLAINCGAGMYANAFLTASRIPRVFFDILFASAIAASFIPVYTEYKEKKGTREAQKFAGNFITIIGVLTLAMSVLGAVFSGQLAWLFAPGYDAETLSLCSRLTAIMMPTLFFTGVAYAFVGILQASGEFNVPAFISVLSNVIIIAYYIFFFDEFGVYGLAVAFLAGWAMQAIVQIPALKKKGFEFKPGLSVRNEGMKKVLKLMIPVMISTWVQPVVLTINSRYASSLPGGNGVTALELSTNLYLIIAGVFILSVTNVVFPEMSRQTASDDLEGLSRTVRTTTHVSMFFIVPMMFGMAALSYPLTDLVYGGGKYSAGAVSLTSQAMFFVSLGMVGYALQNILCRVYYAKQDGRTPLVAGIISIAADIVCCELLAESMGLSGLALASAISSTLYAVILMIPLQRSGSRIITKKFCADMLKITVSACIMAVVVKLCENYAGGIVSGIVGKIVVLIAPTLAGVAVYFACAAVLKMDELKYVSGAINDIKRRLSGNSRG